MISMIMAMILPIHTANRQYTNSDLATILSNKSQSSLVYQHSDGLLSTISSKTEDNGDIIYTVTEGDLTDTVRITGNNIIYLNGNKVIVTSETAEAPRRVTYDSSSWQTTACPYGASTDYTAYQTTKYNSNVDFTQTLSSITRAAIVSIF